MEICESEEKKFFIRKNKIKINKVKDSAEIPVFKKETIETIKLASEKTAYSVEEIFQKIISKEIVEKINKLTPQKFQGKEAESIKKFADKITIEFIKNKLRKKQTGEKKEENKFAIKTIGSLLSQKKITKTSLHSEKHYLVNEIRNYFGESAKKGKGSFGFYLGFFSRVPNPTIYQYWSEVKGSRKSIKDQQKLFWWKLGQYSKEKK
ncbi:hypothetical protein L6261_00405 [Candidatus Parcubacteria bacterium]|nr:hypothetical protein [Candidatus Parcubacteria bacterium]